MVRAGLRCVWFASAMLLSATACGIDEPSDPRVKAEFDLVYAKPGGTELKLDLARPSRGEGPFPVVLMIHGGGWRAGDYRAHRAGLMELARRGYVGVSPQYRFAPKHPFPAQVHDVKAAVRWVKAHAKEYDLDPDRVGAVGFSAGGHLSMMLGLTDASDGLEGDDVPKDAPDSRIKAVVNYFGPTDLAAPDLPDATRQILKDFLGGMPKEKPEVAAKASPLPYVSKGDAPILTFQGTKDNLVPATQATKLADAMTAAGIPGRVELLIGAGHGWQGDDLKRTMTETVEFFDRYLKPSKP